MNPMRRPGASTLTACRCKMTTRRIGAGQRQHGAPLVVELVIVVRLRPGRSVRARLGHHRDPARGSQRHGRWILMMRREVDGAQPRSRVQRGQRVDVDARFVDWPPARRERRRLETPSHAGR